MINAINPDYQYLESGESLIFSRNRVQCGSDVTHTEGSAEFELHSPGVYAVNFNSLLFNGQSIIKTRLKDRLHPEGRPIEAATARAYDSDFTSCESVAFSTLVEVPQNDPGAETDPACLTFYCPATISFAAASGSNAVIYRTPSEEVDYDQMLKSGYAISLQKK